MCPYCVKMLPYLDTACQTEEYASYDIPSHPRAVQKSYINGAPAVKKTGNFSLNQTRGCLPHHPSRRPTCSLCLIAFFTVLALGQSKVEAFNIDLKSNTPYRGPVDSFFGFAVAGHMEAKTGW